MAADLQVGLLGGVRVRRGDEEIAVAGTKLQALVALLALAVPRTVSTDRLVEAIWGDDLPGNPANALQAQVSQLRRLLGADAVRRNGAGYHLAVSVEAVDAVLLELLVNEGLGAHASGDQAAAAACFAKAIALDAGVPLAELVDLPFAREASTRLEQLLLAAHEGAIDAKLATGAHAEVIDTLQGLVAAHPLRERYHAQLITALYRAGRQADALAAYDNVRRNLADELGLDPGPELRELERAVLTHDPSLAAPVTLATERRPAPSLPAPLTSFVGRESELERLRDAVGGSRLVTIVGPGGVGKTRLVLQHLAGGDHTELCFVELAPLAEAIAVPETLAAAVGAVDRASADDPTAQRPPITRAIEHLAGRPCTIVFDNCEHVANAVAQAVSALLTGCPGVAVIATSREPLGLAGEAQLPLLPLTEDEAAELFVQRARAVQPAFGAAESEDDLRLLCQRLDLLPLAIELAAARTKSLGLTEIAGRLDDRFGLLRQSGRGSDARHRGLGAAIDWSYELLFDDERRTFCRLALFAGGTTLEAARALCGDDALDTLERLVDRSLLIAEPHGDHTRFRMLESLRAYGIARLEEAGDLDAARADYLGWALVLAEGASAGSRRADQLVWLDRLDEEHDNLRAALSHAAAVDPATGLRIIGALVLPWYVRGRRQEARHWSETFIAAAPDADAGIRAKALGWCGFIAEATGWTGFTQGLEQDLELAERRQREALDLARAVGDPALVADLRMLLLVTLTRRTVAGIDTRAEDLAAMVPEALAAYTEIGDEYGCALIQVIRAILSLAGGDLHAAAVATEAARAHTRATHERFTSSRVEWMQGMLADIGGDPATAYRHIERSLRLLDELGLGQAVTAQATLLVSLAERSGQVELASQWRTYVEARIPHAAQDDMLTVASARSAEGHAARARGDLERAQAAFLEARTLYTDADVSGGLASTESSLGFLAASSVDPATAAMHHAAALDAAVQADEPAPLALALEGAASVVVDADPATAAALLGAAEALWQQAPAAVAPHRDDLEPVRGGALAALGADELEAARARGAAFPLAEALATAHEAIALGSP